MNLWQRLSLLSLIVSLVACGGSTSTSLNPAPVPVQGDITVQSSGASLALAVRFPQFTSARRPPTTSDGSSSIPFGTEDIRITATSLTASLPYSQEVILTPANPTGSLTSVPAQATLEILAQARQTVEGSQVIASATTTLVPTASPVVSLRLTPASFIPVLQGLVPNPAVAGSLVTLQGQNLSAAQTVLFTAPGTEPPLAAAVVGSQVTIPEGAISGPVIALNATGAGLGVVQLLVTPVPSPSPTPVPSPSPTPVPSPSPTPVPSPSPTPLLSVTSFTPTSGAVGTSVVITGTNFTTVLAVGINGVNAPFTILSDTELQVTIPSTATSGNFSIIGFGATAFSPDPFTVIQPTVESILDGLAQPLDITATDNDGLVLIVSERSGKLLTVNPVTGESVVFASGLGSLTSIIVDPTSINAVLVAEANSGRVLRVTLGGEISVFAENVGTPIGLDWDPRNSQIVVADASPGLGRIFQLDTSGAVVGSLLIDTTQIGFIPDLRDIAVINDPLDPNSSVYLVTVPTQQQILQINRTGLVEEILLSDFFPVSIQPFGLDPALLFVTSSSGGGQLYELDLSGEIARVIGNGLGDSVQGLYAVSPSEIYVIQFGSEVETNGAILRVNP